MSSSINMLDIRTAIKFIAQMELLRNFQHLRKKAFSHKFLLATNIAISLGLSTAGDILQQKYEIYESKKAQKDQKFDMIRTRNMGLSGCTVGIICHYWYKMLDRRLSGRTIDIVVKKILLDQLICSPLYITVFFITVGALERATPAEIWREIKTKAMRLYIAEWVVWPLAQFINFYWLPLKYRVFYMNTISLGYDVYTSKVKHEDETRQRSH